MSSMKFMEKLLDGAGVEWKALGEVVSLQRGKRLVKSQLEETGKHAVYQNCMTPLGYYHESNVKSDTAFIISAGAAGQIGYSDVDFWAADDVYFFLTSGCINSKFLYHFLLTQQNEITSQVRRASIPRLSRAVVEKLQLPIPCPENPKKSLEIQAEIVRILDAFTALTAELTAELNMRKKQYNYYRDKLLSFTTPPFGHPSKGGECEVEWKALGEIGEFIRGNGLQKSDFTESGIGCIHYGQIYTFYGNFAYQTKSFISPILAVKLKKAQKGDLIIATTSENIEDVCKPLVWLGEDEVCVSGETYIYKHNQNPKYLAYYLQTPIFFEYKKRNRTGTKVIRVHGDKLAEFRIPVPSLTEQDRIVTILDKFDALTNSITEGLPREIEMRQKQYEYYRDLLLSFPKNYPALAGTPPDEGNRPRPSRTSSEEGNRTCPSSTSSEVGNISTSQFPSFGGVPEGRGGSSGVV